MKNAIIFVIALAVSNFACTPSPPQNHGKYAAPFGLEWGMSKEQVTAMGVELTPWRPNEGGYQAKTLPQNLSDAEIYTLAFKQEFGLVKVIVVTRKITGDLYGSKGKERYSQLKTAMVNKYGKPGHEYEKRLKDKFFGASDKFYECLALAFCGAWESQWGNKTDGLITLQIRGIAQGTGFIALVYQSAVFPTALKQEKAGKSRSDEDAL